MRLRRFRQSTVVAVGITGLLLMTVAPEEAGVAQDPAAVAAPAETAGVAADQIPDTVAVIEDIPVEEILRADTQEAAPEEEDSTEEATGALRDLWLGFVDGLPKYLIALAVLMVAGVAARMVRVLTRRLPGRWERATAVTALARVVIWLLALGIAVSVLVGDIRALVGSLGLVGLALSWALQTPIESFTGWLLNSFHGFYRVGDRITVGEVFGDVYRINVLTTTVWEYGSPDRGTGAVHAEQPTGRLITFPNNEILTGSIVNYTRDFPFIWDEITLSVAGESDLAYAAEVMQRAAAEVLGDYMREPARAYRELLLREGLPADVPDEPKVFLALTDWGANLTVRYLVGAREGRSWKTRLGIRLQEELGKEEHSSRIIPVYPRQQIQMIGPDGRPVEVETDRLAES